MKLNTTIGYKRIMSTKGFSLNDELNAWDGAPEQPTAQEPVNDDYFDRPNTAEVRDLYAAQDEIAHSAAKAQERETFDACLKYALQKMSDSIPAGKSKRPRVIYMSQLPRSMKKELSHYVGFRGA